jgi:hypothetical protein
VGKAFGLDAAGSGVGLLEADPAAVDATDAADDGACAGCGDVCAEDPALGCGARTELITGAEGPPECAAMHAVLRRASAATAQPIASARKGRKVSIGTDPGTARAPGASADGGGLFGACGAFAHLPMET